MNIKKKKLSDIIPADYNPRSISDKALDGLEKSIIEFGLVQPLIWNKRTERLVGGHQRLKVLQKQGVTETDVIVIDLDETKEKALNITLNNQKIQGEFDYEKLQTLLDDIKLNDDSLFETLSLDEFVFEYKDMPEENLNVDNLLDNEKKITCPKCGFEYERN